MARGNRRSPVGQGASSVVKFHQLISSVTVLQAVQSDLGITLDSTCASAGTSPPILSLTGSCPGYGFRVEVNDTSGGTGLGQAKFRYYANGVLVASGITTGASVPLAAPLAGITLSFAAGPYTNNNIYRTRVSGWADQTANAKDYTTSGASVRPIIGDDASGRVVNTFPSLSFTASLNHAMTSSLNLPAAGTTPTFVWMVAMVEGATVSARLVSANNAANSMLVMTNNATGQIAQYNATQTNAANGPGLTLWRRIEAFFNNATTDYVKNGADTTTGNNSGNIAVQTGRVIGKQPGGTMGDFSILALLYCSGKPNASELAALSAAVTAKYGVVVTV